MIFLSSFIAHPRLGQRLCFIFSLLSTAAFAQNPFFEITQKPAQVAVTTAHPMATEAALKMLQQGGSAIDAAIAAQLMLGLVESQSVSWLYFALSQVGDGLIYVRCFKIRWFYISALSIQK